MTHKTSIRPFLFALPLLALIGCGDDDGGPEPLLRGTLAYVVFECRVEPEVVTNHAELRVRKGEGEPVTVAKYEVAGDPEAPLPNGFTRAESCERLGSTRLGPANVLVSPFQLVAVSPDGSRVAFELTEQFLSGDPPPNQLPPEEEGIFVVRADGSNLRRLGPASSVPSFIGPPPNPAPWAGFTFSPDSRRLVFVDQGVGPAGEDALQVWTQDVVSGERIQVTSLPSGPPECLNVPMPRTCCARFLDNETIEFAAVGLKEVSQPPCPGRAPHTIKTNGEDLREIQRNPIATENPQLGETFIITGQRPAVGTLLFPGAGREITCPTTLEIAPPLGLPIHIEVFYFDGDLLLQLTDFQFNLTAYSGGSTLSTDGLTAFFTASANPFGTNPSQGCQLFSVDVLGSNLRQLTFFDDVEHSTSGCAVISTPDCGCTVVGPYQDPWTEAIIFYSSCDPFGMNPYGGEMFAMRPDGTDLRQLTETRGFIDNRDSDGNGSFVVELPGPYAYSSKNPGGFR